MNFLMQLVSLFLLQFLSFQVHGATGVTQINQLLPCQLHLLFQRCNVPLSKWWAGVHDFDQLTIALVVAPALFQRLLQSRVPVLHGRNSDLTRGQIGGDFLVRAYSVFNITTHTLKQRKPLFFSLVNFVR